MDARDYLTFKEAISSILPNLGHTYSFHELDYEAIGLDFGVLVRAKYSKGEAFDYGESVSHGAKGLRDYVANYAKRCPNTKFVLGGYSQGAQVVSTMLRDELNTGIVEEIADNIVYAATIADPKLYLPEGMFARACRTEERSDYRAYVPDCRTWMGILEGYGFSYLKDKELWQGKVGAWCNYHDFICSSRFDVAGFLDKGFKTFFYQHTQYVELGLYRDVAEKIYNKLAISYGFSKEPYIHNGTRDVAFVFDSTGSMSPYMETYKAEAERAAERIFEEGGRIALYEYRDLDDPFTTKKYCDFESCTMETFREGLSRIEFNGGGDDRESLLSALKTTLNGLSWNVGATKTIMVYTDAGFHIPDRDGTTLQEVIVRTKEIDPVHVNIISHEEGLAFYPELGELAEQTGGKTYTSEEEEVIQATEELTTSEFDDTVFDYGEGEGVDAKIQRISAKMEETTAKVEWEATDSLFFFVSIDGNPLGFVEGSEVEITDIDTKSTVRILPYGTNGKTGEAAEVVVGIEGGNEDGDEGGDNDGGEGEDGNEGNNEGEGGGEGKGEGKDENDNEGEGDDENNNEGEGANEATMPSYTLPRVPNTGVRPASGSA